MKKSVLKRLIIYIKPYKFYLFLAFFSAILSVCSSLLNPILIGKAIDFMISKNNVNYSSLLQVSLILLSSIIIGSILQLIMTRCTNKITYNAVKDIRVEAFNKLNTVPLKYIDSNSHGDIISKIINDIEQISDGLLQGFSQLFTGIITIIGTIGFMLSINVFITFVVILVTPLSLLVASYISKHSHDMFKKQSKIQGELTGYIDEMISNQKIVKSFLYESKAQKHFEEINNRLYNFGFKAQFYSALTNPCTRFVNGIVYAAVGIVGALYSLKGLLSIGQISSFLSYANQYTKPFNEISGVFTQFQAALASASRIFEMLDAEDEKFDNKNAITLNSCNGKINIKNISFSYDKSKKLIENFNLSANPGDNIAIVGPTGCGKTTLINLLMKFYDANSGKIEIDDIDIDNLKKNSIRGLYGMVLQDTWLYSGTIKDNIAYGNNNASYKEIVKAAKAAHAHEFIKKLPNGYDTYISNDGSNLSQGQKQLLCIARVMLTNPSMLILDEATSSIDTRTELYIQKAFNEMMKGRTSFIVAHRLSTIREADIILVMKDGSIIEKGKHEELLKKKGFYYNLYNSQFAK
ncbi:MAG: ABC transporter ATP-binding protein [Clostridium sp.]|nr:ABC transporter ATP-binding protein [Clostridium sp.]